MGWDEGHQGYDAMKDQNAVAKSLIPRTKMPISLARGAR
ncbi:hypothetical protein X566_11630 [Afipia sp. P52-10]|nr:hypothetical protein X566_11630 [Afipia sp. P52-10]